VKHDVAELQQGVSRETPMSEPLTFLASIAPLQSAITIASDGGARVKIDIPEEEMPAIVRLMLMRGKVLRITVEVQLSSTYGSTETNRRTKRSPLDVAGG
jgi:hypothetical protein